MIPILAALHFVRGECIVRVLVPGSRLEAGLGPWLTWSVNKKKCHTNVRDNYDGSILDSQNELGVVRGTDGNMYHQGGVST